MDDETTPRERRERESEWYSTLVAEVDDLVTVVDADGILTYVSPAVTRVLGYEPDDLVGHEGYEFVHPEDRERNADALETVLSNPDESETVELRFRHADGSWRWIEATLRNRLDDDIVGGVLLSSRDITGREEYELEARELAEEYEALLNNVEDAIFLIRRGKCGARHHETCSVRSREPRWRRTITAVSTLASRSRIRRNSGSTMEHASGKRNLRR
jgi:PAS domain S-box-containing protein